MVVLLEGIPVINHVRVNPISVVRWRQSSRGFHTLILFPRDVHSLDILDAEDKVPVRFKVHMVTAIKHIKLRAE
jgi:hypothetical protein